MEDKVMALMLDEEMDENVTTIKVNSKLALMPA